MQTSLFIRTFCLALVLLVAACAPTAPSPTAKPAQEAAAPRPAQETPAAKPAGPAPTPKPAGEQPKYGGVLTWSQGPEPASFDIHQESGGQHPLYLMPAYNGLLQYDPFSWPESKIVPDMASSWEISPNGLEYTFRLKSDIKWHDGRPLTSEDVKLSIDRVRTPPRGTRSPRQAAFRPITEVQAIAPDTVRIRLNRPSAALFSILAIDWLAILPKHVIEAKGDMKRDILGTGPFKFKGYVPGTSYEYVKNGDYFVKGRPYLDGLKIFVIKDDATRFAALRTARILYLPFPYGVSATQANIAKTDRQLVVQSNWRPSLYHFRMNIEKSPWSDPRVRRAANLALDRQAFIDTVLEGAGIVAAQMPSRGLWGIPEDELLKMPGYRQPREADIAEAKKLMAEAGLSEGFKTLVLSRSEEVYQKQGTFVIAELSKIGIKGELVIRVTAAFDDALGRGAFDTVAANVSMAVDEPDLFFGDNYVTGGGRNYGKYSNPKFDEIYDKQSQTLDAAARKKLVQEMVKILLEDNPDVALAWGVTNIALSAKVRNYRIASSPYNNNKHQEIWFAD